MSENTKIEWSDDTLNPIRAMRTEADGTIRTGWHCEHVSEGCRNCYAESINRRLGTGLEFKPANLAHITRDGKLVGDVTVYLDDEMLLRPLKRKRPRRIFFCSMTDLFADFVSDAIIDRCFAMMALAQQHTFQVLTKRSKRMREYFTDPMREVRIGMQVTDIHRSLTGSPVSEWSGLPLPNVRLGVSAEDQHTANERLPDLLFTLAAVRFVSLEPLLGPIDLTRVNPSPSDFGTCTNSGDVLRGTYSIERTYPPERARALIGSLGAKIHQVITGGESGPNARPSSPVWFRSIRDQAEAAGVALLHKQNGEFASVSEVAGPGRHHTFEDGTTVRRVGKKAAGRLLDGVEHNGEPT